MQSLRCDDLQDQSKLQYRKGFVLMAQSSSPELGSNKSRDIADKIKQLLEYQRFAVRRASSIGMSAAEAAEMETRIDQIGELLDLLRGSE